MSSRMLAGMALVAAGIVAFLVLTGGDDRYLVRVEMKNAGGLRNGANVRVGGAPAGRVSALRLDDRDLAVAELRLEPEVAPIGDGATAVVDTDGFFGERFVEIDGGDSSRPRPSGTTIRAGETTVSTRLDDVVDALDLDTRQALQAFLAEQGAAIVGRGEELAEVLAALPPGLHRTGRLLDQFAADNAALGRLVESSDRVVAEVARERDQLGRLIGGFGDTLDVLDSRREGLGETVRRAPATLRSAQRVLASLEAASGPLIPAARGLRATAPALTSTLEQLPGFADEAVPALETAAGVAPDLVRLGTRATPVVRELRPVARTLSTYTRRGLGPFTDLLDQGTADIFGLMEGWARSTQGRDAASHIFRFGATSGSDALAGVLEPAPQKRERPRRRSSRPAPAPAPAPAPRLPKAPKVPKLPLLPDDAREKLDRLLERVPGDAAGDLLDRPGQPSQDQQPLLDFLLGP